MGAEFSGTFLEGTLIPCSNLNLLPDQGFLTITFSINIAFIYNKKPNFTKISYS